MRQAPSVTLGDAAKIGAVPPYSGSRLNRQFGQFRRILLPSCCHLTWTRAKDPDNRTFQPNLTDASYWLCVRNLCEIEAGVRFPPGAFWPAQPSRKSLVCGSDASEEPLMYGRCLSPVLVRDLSPVM